MSNEKNCILRGLCSLAGTERCNKMCPYFISLHGASGKGGRVGDSIPQEYRKFTVAENPVRESQPEIFKKLDIYVKSFERMFIEPEEPKDYIKNLYLWSEEPGTGKTATASAVANDWQAIHYVGHLQRKMTPPEDAVYFLDCAEFQQLFTQFTRGNVPQEVGQKASASYYQMLEKAKKASLLVMDDIGARSASEAFRHDLHAIINHRYVKKMPTVFTSNVHITELTDIFDKKLMDRVRDLTLEFEFKGTSKRGRRK